MNIEDIKSFIEENKDNEEVITVLKGYVPAEQTEITPEGIKEFVKTHETEAWSALQGWYDTQFDKSLATWKGKNLQPIIDEAVRQAHPDETPEQKRIRELEEKINKREAETKAAEQKAIAISYCNKYGLPESVWKAVVGETEEITRNNAARIELDYKSAIENTVENRMSRGYRPKGGSTEKSVEQQYQEAVKKGNPMDVLNAKFSARNIR